ncbi:hypothetical protein FSARC_51 [Fusarium sarcochroum]|uniref:C2H2-type domain-containing protein n=1 Tax=Fusarium sarcochroum TaxID=1208366 RepID=A0A8H4XG08_9HYPO|nr:hypothetical protein FSARC_51 [Fusarium sarcochroum]
MNKGTLLYQPNGSMFSYPTSTLNFDTQSQPQDTFHNKQVANYSWAVQGDLSPLNTNVQGGYPSESPLPLSSSTNGHSNYDRDLISPPTFSTHTSYSEQWPCPNTQDGMPSQALAPRSRKEANEALIKKLRACIWLFLRTRLRLRDLRRRRGRRPGASSYPSWAAGPYNASQQAPPTCSSDDSGLYDLAIADQVNPFNSLDSSGLEWWENSLGIFPCDGNPPFLVPADPPRQATVLSEEEVTPTTVQEPWNEPDLSDIESNQFEQSVFTSSRSRKRPIDCMDPEDSPVDESEQRSRKTNQSKKTPTSPRFACPFYKHDPERYTTSRSCCGPGWESVHRVKAPREHVFRKHKLPENQCLRCFKTFKTGEILSKHSRATVLCEVQSRDLQEQKEGIDASQWRQLHARAKKSSTGSHQKKVEEERWNEVYRIIFPDEEVPSPYYNHLQELPNDDFARKIMADFDKRIRIKLQCMNMQTSLPTEVANVACGALFETMQSCRQANEDAGSPNSQLTTSRSQDTQAFPSMESQFTGISDNLVGELLARSLLDPNIGFNNMGFGTF